MASVELSSLATSLLQDLRTQHTNQTSEEDRNICDEVLVFNHIVDCVSVLHELYLSRISAKEMDSKSSQSKKRKRPSKSIHAGLVTSIGKVLKESLIAESSIFEHFDDATVNRVATSKHILTRFPALSLQRLTSRNIPLIHYAAYNSRSLELVQIVHKANPDAVCQEGADGALPLHWATLNTSSPDIAQFLLQAYPEAAQRPDYHGYLPLHWAVNQSSPVLSVVQSLLECYTEAAATPSSSGALPLHWAVNRASPDIEVVQALLTAHPKGARHACNDQWIPLHYVCNRSAPSVRVIQLLIEAFPDGVSYKNTDGQVPLHRLLDRHNPSKRAVKALIEACPASLRAADSEGYLPLHLCLDGAQAPSVKLVQLLVHSCFQSVKQKTLDGLLPIHLAMKMEDQSAEEGSDQDSPREENVSRTLEIIKELVSLYPESAHEVAVDVQPLQSGANPDTWEGPWRKHRWTPMSLALSHGKNSDLAKLLRPYAKKKKTKRTSSSVQAAEEPQQTHDLQHSPLPQQSPPQQYTVHDSIPDTSISIQPRASTTPLDTRPSPMEKGGSSSRLPSVYYKQGSIPGPELKDVVGNKHNRHTKTFLEGSAMEMV